MKLYSAQVRKGFLLHLQAQHEGKRNQSMKIPEQSLLGSYARSLCHLYFCSQEQSRLHLRVEGFVHISWWMACSNWSLFTIARTLPLLLLAQKGVVTSTFDSHTSDFVLSCGGSAGISACLFALSDAVSLPADLFSITLSSTSMLSIRSSKVPSSTPRLNLWNVGALANCPWIKGAATKLRYQDSHHNISLFLAYITWYAQRTWQWWRWSWWLSLVPVAPRTSSSAEPCYRQ